MKRQNIPSGAKWEDIVGYSRAVRIGNTVEVAGTTAMDGDKIVGENNAYEQTKFILSKIEKSFIALVFLTLGNPPRRPEVKSLENSRLAALLDLRSTHRHSLRVNTA